MFSQEEIIALKRLNQSIIFRPLPMDRQESQRQGNFMWCSDWWHIEVLKCLFHGADTYLGDPPPRRLKNNPLYSPSATVETAEKKLLMLELLKKYAHFSDTLFICEVGRGIDLLLAYFVKPWKKIICYDNNPYILDEVKLYFDRFDLPLELIHKNSGDFDFDVFPDKMIMIGNHLKLGEEIKKKLNTRGNILTIFDGEIHGPTA